MFSGCANQLPPDGGPVDKTPPQIMDVYPADGTTNFHDDHFEISFSKYVQRRTVKDAIFISPAIDGSLQLDWTGKSVDVSFPKKLKKDFTYVVTIGTDVVDYNNSNHLAESYTFRFSTGNKIDKRTITGRVYDNKPQGILIFAYKKDTVINPMKVKPDYISQTGSDGHFKLSGLAEGTYRIFAIRDQYRDLLFQPEQDQYGSPFEDVNLNGNDTLFTNLNFLITQADTIKPRLLSAVMTDKYHILVKFTKEVDTSVIKVSNYSILDSTTNKLSSLEYAFKGETKPMELVLVPRTLLLMKDEYFLIAHKLKDEFGNWYHSDSVAITLGDKPDTTKPGIFKTDPSAGSSNVDFQNTQIKFYFNDSFNSTNIRKAITFTDTSGSNIGFDLVMLDDASFRISAVNELKPAEQYLIKINLSEFKDAAGNRYDTTFVYKFYTISGLDFTGISGKVENLPVTKNPVLVLQSVIANKKTYQQNISKNGSFSFERIEPGKYLLWCYLDRDSSGTYSYGSTYPFKPSEKFSVYPDTVNLRSRWTITDTKFIFK